MSAAWKGASLLLEGYDLFQRSRLFNVAWYQYGKRAVVSKWSQSERAYAVTVPRELLLLDRYSFARAC